VESHRRAEMHAHRFRNVIPVGYVELVHNN
jgi:hypothetical protein